MESLSLFGVTDDFLDNMQLLLFLIAIYFVTLFHSRPNISLTVKDSGAVILLCMRAYEYLQKLSGLYNHQLHHAIYCPEQWVTLFSPWILPGNPLLSHQQYGSQSPPPVGPEKPKSLPTRHRVLQDKHELLVRDPPTSNLEDTYKQE